MTTTYLLGGKNYPYLTKYTKVNSQRILDLYIKDNLIKLMENNVGECLYDLKVDFTTLKLRTSVHPITQQKSKKNNITDQGKISVIH